MSQLHSPRWNASINTSLMWTSTVPSPLSANWTPAEPTPAQQPAKPLTKTQSSQTRPASACGVCRRTNCQLRSHRSYLSTVNSRSKSLTQEPVDSREHPYVAKPKVVDDLTIRTAFTKSYAFVEPSHLSCLQPSSFRVGGFYDLPVFGGDRPDMHALLWDFLNQHAGSLLLVDPSTQPMSLTDLQCACLTAALSNPAVCLCMLATQSFVQKRVSDEDPSQYVEVLMKSYQQYLQTLQRQTSEPNLILNIAENIIYLCMRLMFEPQSALQYPVQMETIKADLDAPYTGELKLLTPDSTMP